MAKFIYTEEIRDKMRQAKLRNPTRFWKGKKLSKEHVQKMRESHKGQLPWNTGKQRPESSGENHWNWRGGITPLKKKTRYGSGYKPWRRKVILRDGLSCQLCGTTEGRMHVDHIKAFAFHPDLRFEVSNGRVLCERCHYKQPTSKNQKHVCCP